MSDIKQVLHKIFPKLDTVGAVMSAICAIHCLLVPFLVLILPVIGLAFILDHWFEQLIMIAAITVALGSFFWGLKTHGELYVFVFLIFALGFFLLANMHELEAYERWFVFAGGLFLVCGHLVNKKLCNTCPRCHNCNCSRQNGSNIPTN